MIQPVIKLVLNDQQSRELRRIRTTCPAVYCWRAVARQPTILYNSDIWPKSVGCKIVDLRSRMRSLSPGACGFGDMRMSIPLYSGYSCECT